MKTGKKLSTSTFSKAVIVRSPVLLLNDSTVSVIFLLLSDVSVETLPVILHIPDLIPPLPGHIPIIFPGCYVPASNVYALCILVLV